MAWNRRFDEDGLRIAHETLSRGRASDPSDPAEDVSIARQLLNAADDELTLEGTVLVSHAEHEAVTLAPEFIYIGRQYDLGADGELADLAEGVVDALSSRIDFPDVQAIRIELKARSTLGSPDFKVTHSFFLPPRVPFTGRRVGAFLLHADGWTSMLTPFAFDLIRALAAPMGSDEPSHMRWWGKVRAAAECAGAKLDTYLENEQVMPVDSLKPVLERRDDGSISLSAAPEGELAEPFRKKFDYFRTPQTKYNIETGGRTGRVRLVPSVRAMEALEEAKQNRVIAGADVPRFVESPEAYLASDAFDLSDFADRVTGIGVYVYKAVPYQGGGSGPRDWFEWDPSTQPPPFEVNLVTAEGESTDEKVDLSAPGVREELEQKVRSAESAGRDHVEVRPGAYVRTDELKGLLASHKALTSERNPEKRKRLVLEIFENIDALEYGAAPTDHGIDPEYRDLAVPDSLAREFSLLPHQQEGYEWLSWIADSPEGGFRGALLADDMGLGKTLQHLATLARLRARDEKGPFLVVAPVSVLENWKREAQRFFPRVFDPIIWAPGHGLLPKGPGGSERRRKGEKEFARYLESANLVLTSYGTLRAHQLSFARVTWRAVALDEAQRIKNVRTRISIAAKGLKIQTRVALTGTPVENSFTELWNIMDFLNPGYLGSLKEFHSEFVTGWGRADDATRDRLANDLRDRIGPALLRRTKQEVLSDLPEKHVHGPADDPRSRVEFGAEQRELYAKEIAAYRAGGVHHFSVLPRLFKVCAHPGLLSEEFLSSPCPKMDRLIEILRDVAAADEKAVVFTASHRLQALIQGAVSREFGILPDVINGTTPAKQRQKRVDAFGERSGFNVIALGPRAAGLGLNIVAANHVIHYTREWNPAVESQCTDRVHRIGQIRPVHVYYPVVVDSTFKTVEQHLDELLREKEGLASSVVRPTAELKVGKEDIARRLGEPAEKHAGVLTARDIDGMDWHRFEALVAALFEHEGFQCELTSQSDFGADVVCRQVGGVQSALVQAKHAASADATIGPDGVQQILAARRFYEDSTGDRFERLIVATNAGFGAHALSIASSNGVELLDRSTLVQRVSSAQLTMERIAKWLQ